MHRPDGPMPPDIPAATADRRPPLASRPALATAAALLCLACGSDRIVPSGPLDPALTGVWFGPIGVDTDDGYTLQQRGTLVTGTHDFYSAVFPGGPSRTPVSGTADLPRVVLRMRDGTNELIATGILSPDSLTLTFTDSVAGGRTHGLAIPYRRSAAP